MRAVPESVWVHGRKAQNAPNFPAALSDHHMKVKTESNAADHDPQERRSQSGLYPTAFFFTHSSSGYSVLLVAIMLDIQCRYVICLTEWG